MAEKKKDQYGRIYILREKLEAAGIDQAIVEQIMEGEDTIKQSTKPEIKAEWLRGAMLRMGQLLDKETWQAVRESCACCLGGKRLELSKAIAKNYNTLEERIQAANGTRMVFGNSVKLLEDGKVQVQFAEEGLEKYRCVCLPKAKEPLPMIYCYCCGGHIKHHLQIALGRQLELKVKSSALSSGGKRPCTFEFTIVS